MFGAGCFWGVEYNFSKLDGVNEVLSGYSGGKTPEPTYEQVCNNSTEHAYPRTTDYAHNRNLGVDSVTTDTFAVYVGVSSSGGLVAPLQMEFIASILENSTT